MADTDYEQRLKKTHRNDPCPCGSGKKYKKCHMPEDEASMHEAQAHLAAEQAQRRAEEDNETDRKSDGRYVPKQRAVKEHLKAQKGKGGHATILPRRIGKS